MNKAVMGPRLRAVVLGAALGAACGVAQANPTGPTVVNGKVGFSGGGGVLNVRNSPGAIINWQGFSIGQGEITRFLQRNANSAVLNRVIGQDPSAILGSLLSNGRVFVVNPNGILFGRNAVVDTQGLIASTLNIKNADFLAGKYEFAAAAGAGGIRNQGFIRSGPGGEVVLIAPSIENSGIIQADDGELVLAAGRKVTLTSLDAAGVSFDVQAPEDSVLNLGQLIARRGSIGAFGGTLRNTGRIEAGGVGTDAAGNIVLMAKAELALEPGSVVDASGGDGGVIRIESEGGSATVDGVVNARGASGRGGQVDILGEQVMLQAAVDASGERGGGRVRVGGGYRGEGALRRAARTEMTEQASIDVSARGEGDGGVAVVWADGSAEVRGSGNIAARGGVRGGDGGTIETSGKQQLWVGGAPDASAPAGEGGLWLLDPINVVIASGGSFTGPFTDVPPVEGASSIDADALVLALQTGTNVTITTADPDPLPDGDITVASGLDAIDMSAFSPLQQATLSLVADGNVIVPLSSGGISAFDGDLDVLVNAAAGVNIAAPISGLSSLLVDAGLDIDITAGGAHTGIGDVQLDAGAKVSIAAPISGLNSLLVNAGTDIDIGADVDHSGVGGLQLNAPGHFIFIGDGASVNLDAADASSTGSMVVGFLGGGALNINNGEWQHGGTMSAGAGSGSGMITITGGGKLRLPADQFLVVGGGSGSTGNVTVSGTNSKLELLGGLTLSIGGPGAHGTVRVEAAGDAYVAGDVVAGLDDAGVIASIQVDGPGSSLAVDGDLYVGGAGEATVSIVNNGAVTASNAYFGVTDAEFGSLSPSGRAIGGTGILDMSLAATLDLGAVGEVPLGGVLSIGHSPGTFGAARIDDASVTIFGPDSALQAGERGSTTTPGPAPDDVVIRNGAFVQTLRLKAGEQGVGRIRIEDTDSDPGIGTRVLVDAGLGSGGEVNIGVSGTGSVTLSGGADLDAAGLDFFIGRKSGSVGSVQMSGSGNRIHATRVGVGVDTMAGAQGGSGSLTFLAGTEVLALDVINAGLVQGAGHIVTGNLVAASDGPVDLPNTVVVGAPAGILLVDGDFTANSQTVLRMELGGTDDLIPEYDILDVGGVATLAGQIEVTLIDEFTPGYTPSPGDLFSIIRAGTFVDDQGAVVILPPGLVPLFSSFELALEAATSGVWSGDGDGSTWGDFLNWADNIVPGNSEVPEDVLFPDLAGQTVIDFDVADTFIASLIMLGDDILEVNSGLLSISATAFADSVVVDGGSLVASLDVQKLQLNSGTLEQGSTPILAGEFEWNGGDVQGETSIIADVFNLDTPGPRSLDGVITINGGGSWGSALGRVTVNGASLIRPRMIVADTAAVEIVGDLTLAGLDVDNDGRLNKTGGSGVSILATLNNTGILALGAGRTNLEMSSMSFSAQVNVNGPGELVLSEATHDISAPITLDSAGVLLLSSGTHSLSDVLGAGEVQATGGTSFVSDDYDVGRTVVEGGDMSMDGSESTLRTGELQMLSGQLDNGGVFDVGALLFEGGILRGEVQVEDGSIQISGPGTKELYGTLRASGTVTNWIEGNIDGGETGAFENQGGSQFNADADGFGTSSLFLANTARVLKSTAGTTNLEQLSNDGEVILVGGTLNVGSYQQLAAGSRLSLEGGDIASAFPLNVGNGIVQGSGDIDADLGMSGPSVLSPGLSIGDLRISGDLQLSASSRLVIEVDGREPGAFDTVTAGSITLTGGPALDVAGTFAPAGEENVTPILCTAGTGCLNGTFGAVNLVSGTISTVTESYQPESVDLLLAGVQASVWIGGQDLLWTTPDNWSLNAVPERDSQVQIGSALGPITINGVGLEVDLLDSSVELILAGGEFSVFGDAFIGADFRLVAGVLDGPGDITVGGRLVLQDAILRGGGKLEVAAGGVLGQSGVTTLDGRTLINLSADRASRVNGEIGFLNAAQLTNAGILELGAGARIGNPQNPGNGTFTNAGTLVLSAAGTSAALNSRFVNSGILDIQSGSSLSVTAGAGLPGFVSSGAVSIGAGGALRLLGGGSFTFDPGSTITGAGQVELSGGADVVFNTSMSIPDLNIRASNLTVNGDLDNSGLLSLTSGSGNSGNSTVIVTGALNNTGTIRASGAGASHSLQAKVFNSGLVEAVAADLELVNAGAEFSHDAGTLRADGQQLSISGGVVRLLGGALSGVNGGEVDLFGTAAEFAGGDTLIDGQVRLSSPTFAGGNATVAAGAVLSLDAAIVDAGSALNLGGGDLVLQSTLRIGSAGALNLTGNSRVRGSGSLDALGSLVKSGGGAANLDVPLTTTAGLDVTGGTLAINRDSLLGGNLDIGSGSVLAITGGTHQLASGTALRGIGTAQIVGANLNVTGSLTSSAVLELLGSTAADSTLTVTGRLTNTGTIRSSGGPSVTNILAARVSNSGVVEAVGADLEVQIGSSELTHTAGALRADGQQLILSGGGTLRLLGGDISQVNGGNVNLDDVVTSFGAGDTIIDSPIALSNVSFGGGIVTVVDGGFLSVDNAALGSSFVLNLAGGGLQFSNSLDVFGTLNLDSGIISGVDAAVLVASGGVLNALGSGNRVLDFDINNAGTVNLGGLELLGAQLSNLPGGTLNLRGNTRVIGSGSITNQGALFKVGGGTATVAVPLTTSTGLNVASGTLALNRDSLLGGNLNTSPDGILTITGGSHQLADGTAFRGAGTVQLDGTRLRVNGNLINAVNLLIADSRIDAFGGLDNTGSVRLGDDVALNMSFFSNRAGAELRKVAGSGESILGMPMNSVGDVAVERGTLKVAAFNQRGGDTRIASGATLAVSDGMLLQGGTLGGNGRIDGNVFNGGGVLSAGASPGILFIDGDYRQRGDGELLVELSGLAPGEYDLLGVSGTASLDGTLEVRFDLPSFPGAVGDRFQILFASEIELLGGPLGFSNLDAQQGYEFDPGQAVLSNGFQLVVTGTPAGGLMAPPTRTALEDLIAQELGQQAINQVLATSDADGVDDRELLLSSASQGDDGESELTVGICQ